MFDPRIYRAAFVPAIAAIVALMFSLERAPEPLETPVSTPLFQAQESSQEARGLARDEPVRTPGSGGDRAAAALVRDTFAEISGGEVSQQTFETSFDGATVEAENIILTLPGRRPETLLIVAPRDTQSGAGATTSAASTATLLTLAEILGGSPHERTIVLASVSATNEGSRGIRELVEALPVEGRIEAAIDIAAPGVRDRRQPFVFPGRAGNGSPPAVLLRTADQIATLQFGEQAAPTGAWSSLVRLALPFGIGPGAALADEGLEAITISASGERPPDPSDDVVWRRTMFMAGSTVLDLVLTLDAAEATVGGGPGEYLTAGDNLLPAWTLSLLALTLILPSLLAAGDVWLRDRRRDPRKARRSIPWVLERALPALAALILAYLLGLVGLIADPAFPYDPRGFSPGARGAVALVALVLAASLAARLIRPLRTPIDAEPQTLAAAAGLIGSVALLGIWLLEPFMALLLAPTAHLWVLPARAQGPPKAATIGVFALLSLAPIAAATIELASSLDLGLAVVWQLLLLIVSGQIGILAALLWCVLLGGLLACIAAAGAGRPEDAVDRSATRLRGPRGYAGPGSLGGTPSSLRR